MAIRPMAWIVLVCMVAVLSLSIFPVETGCSAIEEYLCLVIPSITVIGVIICIKQGSIVKFSMIDGIVFGWYLYSMGRFWFEPIYPAFGFAIRTTLMLLIYTSLRVLFSSVRIKGDAIVIMLIFFAVIEMSIGYYQLLYGISRHPLYPVTGSFLNPGPYSAYIALGMVLLLSMNKQRIGIMENRVAFLLVLLGMQLVLTMSRAAFLAVGICMLMQYNSKIRGLRQWLMLVGIALAAVCGLYLLKSGSADGRGIINYIGIRCFAVNPWTGSGIGSFFHRFAEETAWLSRNSHTENLMKVDVIDYAFNDLMRVGVEQGALGLIFATALISVVMVRLWKNCRTLFLGALSLLIFSLFSYPFELLPYQIIATVMAAFAGTSLSLHYAVNGKHSGFCMALRFVIPMVLIGTLSLCCRAFIKERIDAEKGYGLISGFDDKAFTKDYFALMPYLLDNKRFLFDFAKLLSKQKRYNDSNDMLRNGARISNDPMFLVLQGNNYRDMGAVEEAEKAYLKAWQTMPNRIYPLYRLMMLYHDAGNRSKALKYAKKVVAFKEKIPSPAVRDMKREAQEIIKFGKIRI